MYCGSLFHDNSKGAVIDKTGLYRYLLWRIWDEKKPRITWIMLNPSTADAEYDDPTIRKCIKFSKAWGAGSLEVVNLFAYRATDPKELCRVQDPIGAENDHYIIEAISKAQTIIAAWGVHGGLYSRNKKVADRLSAFSIFCLGVTKDGHPKHPLYVPYSISPIILPIQNSC